MYIYFIYIVICYYLVSKDEILHIFKKLVYKCRDTEEENELKVTTKCITLFLKNGITNYFYIIYRDISFIILLFLWNKINLLYTFVFQ